MLKIDTCIIVKNEKDNIQKLVEQLFLFSHEVHVTDTGSDDGTLDILKKIQKKNKKLFIHHFDWIKDFGAARNYSLYCYKDSDKSDFKFWCDADDLLTDDLIKQLNEFKKQKLEETTDAYLFDYLYAKQVMFFQKRLSLIKTSSHLIWYDPIHEYLGGENGKEFNTNITYFSTNKNAYIEHQRKHVHTSRNLDIFLNMLTTNREMSSRNLYYFASELENSGYAMLAVPTFANCIYYEDNNLVDKINAALAIARIFDTNKQVAKYFSHTYTVKDIFLYLYDKQFIRADMLATIGMIYFNENKKTIAENYFKQAEALLDCNPVISFMYDRKATEITVWLQLSVIEFYDKHNIAESLRYNTLIVEKYPDCANAVKNKGILENLLNGNKK